MITKEFAEAAKEINDIFNHIEKEEFLKLPKELIDLFKEIEDKDYITNLDYNKPLYEMELKNKTKDILVYLYATYWCKDEDKEELEKILRENYIKEQKELKEKYNPDDIFKTKENKNNNRKTSNVMPAEYKESIFKKIINKIKKSFSLLDRGNCQAELHNLSIILKYFTKK